MCVQMKAMRRLTTRRKMTMGARKKTRMKMRTRKKRTRTRAC